ncbi:MAG: hypothetical protein V9E94_10480 [Microthrixaceae bacterium]
MTATSRARAVTRTWPTCSKWSVPAALEHGRDPSSITLTSGGGGAVGSRAHEEVEALAAMGVGRVILPSFLFWNDPEESLAAYGDEVISRFV